MLRFVVFCCVVALSVGNPAVPRTQEQIEQFRQNLVGTQRNDGKQLRITSPYAITEENSGKFQGDIILDDDMIDGLVNDFASGRNAYQFPGTTWPNNTVLWDFNNPDEFNEKQIQAIFDGMKDIEEHTCVKFKRREPGDFTKTFVNITGVPDGCYAHVGHRYYLGPRTFNLAPLEIGVGCFRHTTIVHEWMHILGFFHMHSTHDRDEYVKIVMENVMPGFESNLALYDANVVDNYGIEYDYVSCLQYPALALSANGKPTIVALKEHEGVMGQREFVSDKDWLRINRHYQCPGAFD
ncbi:hypothetical protein ACJJTC_016745 [Scirpophaga incertulas]